MEGQNFVEQADLVAVRQRLRLLWRKPLPVEERAVERAVVLQLIAAAVRQNAGVPARDPAGYNLK